jgi:hypothetical protein
MTAAITVGLLDSGVDSSLVPAAATARFRTAVDGSVESRAGGGDLLGHGTALARIITSVPVPVALFDAAIFEDRWLRADRAVLRRACERALDSGVILIAAAPARGPAVFPGSYPGVIRATGDARCAPGEISALGGGQADFAGYPRPLGDDGTSGGPGGASFGTAHVTAAVAEFLSRAPEAGRAEVVRHLAAIAKHRGPERRRFAEGPS